MIDALSIAANGLISSRKKAVDAAAGVVKSVSSSPGDERNREQGDADTSAQDKEVQPQAGVTATAPLVQHIVGLKSAQTQFQASAEAFKRISESQDQLLGKLIDDEG